MFFNVSNVFAGFVHPMDFTKDKKKEVLQYIKAKVHDDYCNGMLDMCTSYTLRIMEKQELNAFKQATKAKNRSIMDRVISDYCSGMLNMCTYSTILMMYQEELKASNKSLTW